MHQCPEWKFPVGSRRVSLINRLRNVFLEIADFALNVLGRDRLPFCIGNAFFGKFFDGIIASRKRRRLFNNVLSIH